MASSNTTGGSITWNLDVDDSKLTAGLAKAKASVSSLGETINSTDTTVGKSVDSISRSTQTSMGAVGSSVDEAGNSVRGLGTTAKGSSDDIEVASNAIGGSIESAARRIIAYGGLTTVIYGVGRALKDTVSSFADYDSELGILQAVTNATKAQMAILGAQATALGNDISLPGVSAADAATAMTELGKAGLGVNDILGASKGVLSLATAGQLDVADAATITANALNSFGLKGSEASRVADLLSAGANSSTASVQDMALSLGQAGAGAKQMGVTVQDTVTALSLFSNAGIAGSDAGTSLKQMFQQLAAPTKQASDLMKQLGLNFFDAHGNFIGLQDASGLLQTKLGGLSTEAKNAALAVIFGSDSSRVAGVLADQGAAGFAKMAAAVNQQGAAAKLAASANNGIKGSLSALQSGLETVGLQVGQFISAGLKPLIDAANSNLPVALALVASVVVTLGAALVATIPEIGAFTISLGAAALAIAPWVLAAAGIAVGLTLLQQRFDIFGKALNVIKPIVQDVTSFFNILFAALAGADPTVNITPRFVKLAQSMQIIQLASLAVQDAFKTLAGGINVVFAALSGADPTVNIAPGFVKFAQAMGDVQVASLALQGAIKKLLGDLTPVGQFVEDNLVAAFTSISKTVGPALKQIGDVVTSQLLPALKPLQPLLKPLAIALALVFAAPILVAIATLAFAIGTVVAAVTALSFILKIVAPVIGAAITVVAALIGVAIAVGSAILDVIVVAIKTMWSVVSTVFNAIAVVWQTVLKPVFDTIVFVLNALFTVWWTVFSSFYTIVFTIFSTIAQIIGVILQGTFNWIYNNFLAPVGQAFATMFQIAADIVSSVFGSIYNTVVGWVNAIIGFFRGSYNAVRSGFLQPFSDALGAFYAIAGDFVNAGESVITGIVNGIKSGSGQVVKEIENICSSALDAVKKFFGIHSPSTVMASMGGFLMQGLAGGISQTGGQAVDAMTRVSGSLQGAVGGLSGGVAVSGSYGTSGGLTGRSGITQTNNYNIYSNIDMKQANIDAGWGLANA